MRNLPLLAAALLVVGAPAALRAEDETRAVRRVDLGDYAPPPVATGPVLPAPSDLSQDERKSTTWSLSDHVDGEGSRATWIAFPETPGSWVSMSGDQIMEAARWGSGAATHEVGVDLEARVIRLAGPPEQVRVLGEAVQWAAAGVAPSAWFTATLSGGAEGGVLAHGRVRLFAGRWTRVWLQEDRPRFPCDWDIEIAQATTAVHPVLQELPEGQELYARWVPGESLSLVELWTGDLEHQEVVEVDFTPIRNVPEASGLGPTRAPRTALRRGYTALAFAPRGGPAQAFAWDGPEGSRRLDVALEGESARPEPRSAEGDAPSECAWIRVGASAAGLLFESRPRTAEVLLQELSNQAQNLERGAETELNLVGSDLLIACRSAPAVRAALVQRVREEEAALGQVTLALRVVTLPEESARQALRDGVLAAGRALAPAAATLVDGVGAVRGSAVVLPLLQGVKSGLRCGASVPGLVAFDVEVAQEAGGMDPRMGVVFAGLAGEAQLLRTHDGRLVAHLDLTLSWADPKGGRVDLTVRPPVWMTQVAGRNPVETETPKRVTLATLTHGAAEVAAQLDAAAAGAPETLLGIVSRGSEVALVLGRATSR